MPTANEAFEYWIGKDVELVDRPLFCSDACPAVASKGVVVGVLIAYVSDDVGASHVLVDFDRRPGMFCEVGHVRRCE